VHLIGVLAQAPFAFLTFYVCLAFPRGRLGSSLERRLMGAWAVTLGLIWIPSVLVQPAINGNGPLSLCTPSCPPNPLQIATAPEWAATVTPTVFAIAVALAALIIGIQIARLFASSVPQRRARWPVAGVSLLFLVSFSAYYLSRGLVPVEGPAVAALEGVYLIARLLLPLGFLLALVRADFFAARAAHQLAERLAGVGNQADLRESLATALGDPGLRIGFWDAGRQRFIDGDGAVLPPIVPERGEMWVPVMQGDNEVAGIVADQSLASETDLLAAASAATIVALNDERAVADAMALRVQVVNATDEERQRIARDLHDSAQQRLVALRIQIGLASDGLDSQDENYQVLLNLGDELDAAIDELRNVSRRFLSPFVVRNGVAPAIRSITLSWPIEVAVEADGLTRHHPQTELTVYNCCLEALQNSLEHGGSDVKVTVRLTDSEPGNGITFSVIDDGVGFDPQTTQPGAGMLAMADRALVAGGSVTMTAAPGFGVVVSGSIPDRAVPGG
jgi:signal transduction histidine kinase